MKLPYRLGDSFALPLGNGQFARSCIVQCEHRVVVIRAWIGEESWLDLRVSDDALVVHRWKRDGSIDVTKLNEPRAQNIYWMTASRAERIVAASIGAPHPRERKISIREVLDGNASDALATLDDDCILAFTQRLVAATVERVAAALHNHPGVTIRMSGDAMTHLNAFASAPIGRLTIAGPIDHIPPLPALRHLEILYPHNVQQIAAAAPNLASLRFAVRGSAIDLRDLRALPDLQTLDLSLIAIADAKSFGELAPLRALRVNRVTGIANMDAIATLPLQALALEHLHELQSTAALAHVTSMEQLELHGLWQLAIPDVEWALEHEGLLRAEIDIGGRRKNLELYRRAHWAYPWRFPGTSTSWVAIGSE